MPDQPAHLIKMEADTVAIVAEEISPAVAELLFPISEAAPGGEDITYDDDFQKMKAEIDSASSASAAGVNYELIVELGRKVLSKKSKDLRVAVYMATALERTGGIPGVADGLVTVEQVTQMFWENLYPAKKRMAGRQNALQSLSDNLKDRISAFRPTEADRPHLDRSLGAVRALQAFCMEAMGEQAPALSGLQQALEDVLRRIPKPAAAPPPSAPTTSAPPPGQAAPAAPAYAPAPAPSAPAAAAGELTPATAERTVLQVADFLREKDPADPIPYRLVRAYRFTSLKQEPASEGGKTRLEGPPGQRLTFLSGLLERGEHARLIQEAENSFHEFRFWLTCHRLVDSAMEAMGEPYRAAREAIRFEAAILLKRLPKLADLAFSDGTPFADGATMGWIETRVTPLLEAEGGGGSSSNGQAAGSEWGEYLKQAREKLGGGDLKGALAVMEQGGRDRSAADRFRRSLYLASLCLSAGKAVMAQPVLERLDEEVEERRLDEWDPDLAVEVWSALHRCYASAGKKDSDMQARATDVFRKICRVDLEKALALA